MRRIASLHKLGKQNRRFNISYDQPGLADRSAHTAERFSPRSKCRRLAAPKFPINDSFPDCSSPHPLLRLGRRLSPSLPHPLKSRMFHSANHRQNPILTIVIAAFHSTIFKTNFTATSMRPTQPCSQCYLSPEGVSRATINFSNGIIRNISLEFKLAGPVISGFSHHSLCTKSDF